MFSVEQLDHLASIGIFRPSQLNDATRIDVSHEPEPFIAVDCTYAHEIDDAIRVKRLRGGAFIVQAAIADGSQLSDTPQLVEEAITKRESTYSYRHIVKSILPFGVIRELELRQPVNRALVVSQRFSKDGEQIDEPEITPSIVRIRRANLHDFAWEHFDNARRSQYDSPMVSFHKVFAHSLGKKFSDITPATEAPEMIAFSNKIVARQMVLANIAIATWATQHDLPILYRHFSRNIVAHEENQHQSNAHYSADLSSHECIDGYDKGTVYCHATSPLRRAADLVNHLQIGSYLAGDDGVHNRDRLTEISKQLNSSQALMTT